MNHEFYLQQLPCEQISVKFKPNTIGPIHENIFQKGGCKMAAILSWLQCVDKNTVAIVFCEGNTQALSTAMWLQYDIHHNQLKYLVVIFIMNY